MAELTTGKVIALIRALSTSSTSSATYTVTDALVIGAATTSGVRLDLAGGDLQIREGDNSGFAHMATNNIYCGGALYWSNTSSSTPHGLALSTGVKLRSNLGYFWSNSTGDANQPADTGLTRDSAAQVVVTDGSTGIGNLRATALIVGTADTNGVRLDLETGVLAVREGDDSAYAPLRCGLINFSGFSANLATGGANLSFGGGGIDGWRTNTTAKTTDYSLTAFNDNGTAFTNEGASGAINLTLPSAASGYHYRAYVQANQYLRFTAAAGDTIRDGATVSAAAGYIRSTTVGSTLYLLAVNATEWVVMSKTGTWTVDS